jgi:RNA polymerase sigma-70 factor (ECF subfamily)
MRLIAGGKATDPAGRRSLDIEAAYRENRVRLFNYFLRCGLPRGGAEDSVQGVFLVLLQDRDRYDPERGSLDVYLFGIARNVRRAYARRHQREWHRDPLAAADRPTRKDADVVAIRESVRRLGEEYREVLILREFHGFSYDEIAAIQGVPKGTVRSRLARAREQLRDLLRPGPRSH